MTFANIRTNAAIRHGVATIRTETAASSWLSLFGSQPRAATELELPQIQSIAFGGLGFLPAASAVGFTLSGDRRACRAWLHAILPAVAFGDGRKHHAGAVIVALSAASLVKLDLPQESLETFPQAFLDGMTAPWRSRALGDEGADAPDHWWWGAPGTPVDGMLLLYAPSDETLGILVDGMRAPLTDRGHAVAVDVPFMTARARCARPRSGQTRTVRFVDGISQPAIRALTAR